jgi:uncharacterized membrane protein YhaH (DUF805 family)
MEGRIAGIRGNSMFSFRGRAGRGEMWLVLILAPLALLIWEGAEKSVAVYLMIPMTWPIAATVTRRLHDLSWNPWPFLGAHLLFIALLVGTGVIQDEVYFRALVSAAVIVGIFILLVYVLLAFVKGNQRHNRYGEADPR